MTQIKMDKKTYKMNTPSARRPFELDDHLPYLINHVGGRFNVMFGQRIRAHGLSNTFWRVIHTPWHTGPLPLVRLASRANFDISTLSRVVSDLQDRGLVTRIEQNHGRRPAVKLTKDGEVCVEELVPYSIELEHDLSSVLTAGERQLLVELLQKLDRRINAMERVSLANNRSSTI